MPDAHTETPTALDRVDSRGSVLDVLLLSVVPVVLLAVYALPPRTRRSLVLDYADPTLVGAYANHFVHLTAVHLAVNLLGYVVVVATGYLLAVAAGRRRQFLVIWAVVLLVFPFAISGFNLLFPRSSIGFGFSGLVMAYLGYLPIAFTGFLGARFDLPVGGDHSHWLFFETLGLIAVLVLPGVWGLAVGAFAIAAGVLFLVTTVREIRRVTVEGARQGLLEAGTAELLVLVVILLVSFPFVAFPESTPVEAGRVNVFSHAVGFCLGYLVPYVTLLVGGLDFEPTSG